MSENSPELVSNKSLTGKKVAIVASLYNEKYVEGLLESAVATFEEIVPEVEIQVFRVPGAYEIPVCVRAIAENLKPDSLVALGVILRGQTEHADLVAKSVTDSLQETATMHLLPVIHEVLLLENEEQAERRCLGEEINRGDEAARAAINMMELFDELETVYFKKQ